MANGNEARAYGASDGRLGREHASRDGDQRVDRATQEYLVKFSHELRGRLNVINGWADVLQSRVAGDEFAERALETIKRNARDQARLIREMLASIEPRAGAAPDDDESVAS